MSLSLSSVPLSSESVPAATAARFSMLLKLSWYWSTCWRSSCWSSLCCFMALSLASTSFADASLEDASWPWKQHFQVERSRSLDIIIIIKIIIIAASKGSSGTIFDDTRTTRVWQPTVRTLCRPILLEAKRKCCGPLKTLEATYQWNHFG